MQPFVQSSVAECMELLGKEAKKGTSFDIYPYFQRLTLDVIAKVAFGYETSVQKGENEELYHTVKSIFGSNSFSGNIFSTLATILPEMRPLWRYMARIRQYFNPLPFFVILKKLRRVVAARKSQKGAREGRMKDFIDLMLEIEAEENWNRDTVAAADGNEKMSAILRVTKKLTSEEIVAQMMVILIAGYETTSTALAFLAYHLATQPDIQDQLYDEIKEHIPTEGEVNHDSVAKLKFLDAVINEGLRLYPHASIVVNRKCMAETEVSGMKIPEGLHVAANVWAVHHDPELWGDDADQFRPSRMLEEATRHPMAFMPFGAGPRICLGMRFALLEEKLALARLLLRFRIKPSPLTPKKLNVVGSVTIGPEQVQIILEERN